MLGAHGGMFDRIDSLLLNVPFVLWYALQYTDLKNQPGYDENQFHFFEFLKVQLRWN